jgi:hypothetical protein
MPQTTSNGALDAECGPSTHKASVGVRQRARTLSAESPCNRRLTTEELAGQLGMSAQAIRKRYSQVGSYFDVRPVKLPNRRLLWPADAVQQLLSR